MSAVISKLQKGCMKEITRREAIKEIGFALCGLTLTALGADSCEKGGAATTPIGPVYWGDAIENPDAKIHEECHDERRKRIGNERYYWRYFNDPEWACQEEIRCGADPNTHPA